MSYNETLTKYQSSLCNAELDTFADYQRQAGEFLANTDHAQMSEWAKDKTRTYELNERNFRMVVDQPNNSDANKVVVVTGEFGNGISPAAVARARIIRDLVASNATLVYQPNTMLGQDNPNFSREERRFLRAGKLSPMLGRLGIVLDSLGGPEKQMLYGPSQGGVVALGHGANPNAPDGMTVAVVEIPNILDRSSSRMAKDFLGCGAQLPDMVRENYDELLLPQFGDETLAALGATGLARFAFGIVRPDNLAMIGILRRNTAEDQIATILGKGGSVVQVNGTVDKVSPADANRRLAAIFDANPLYRHIELTGEDHSITNNYTLNATFLASRKP